MSPRLCSYSGGDIVSIVSVFTHMHKLFFNFAGIFLAEALYKKFISRIAKTLRNSSTGKKFSKKKFS